MITMRRKKRWGADHIAFEVGLAASTVLVHFEPGRGGRLDRGDRATKSKPHRYQREHPGELIHVVKKIAAIPDGGGSQRHGRDNDGYHGHSAPVTAQTEFRSDSVLSRFSSGQRRSCWLPVPGGGGGRPIGTKDRTDF